MLETPNWQIHFEVLDPDLGCLVLETHNMGIHFEVLDPDLGWLVLEPPKLRINFEVRDPDPIVRENVQKRIFFHGLGAAWC